MKPIQSTSDDLLADRRADYAEMLLRSGDHVAAADLMLQAMERVPGWTFGWYRLGEMFELAGQPAPAIEAFRTALRLDSEDRLGASLKLGLLGAVHGIDAPPPAFVETLFDQYSEDFDSALVERLGYRAPELVAGLLDRLGGTDFVHVIDLGCGTGLMGERLRKRASFMEGLDLSEGMLGKARAKGLYDRVARQDLQLWEPDPRQADLVVAADVFNYVGALDRVVASAWTALMPGGRFAFTVERVEGHDFALLPSRRYAHSRDYVARLLGTAGFRTVHVEDVVLRHDRGEPVAGLVVVADKAAEIETISTDAAVTMTLEQPASLN